MTRWGFASFLKIAPPESSCPTSPGAEGFPRARNRNHGETYYLPIAPHNCGGPILHFATAHLAANVTNFTLWSPSDVTTTKSMKDWSRKAGSRSRRELPLLRVRFGVELSSEVLARKMQW